MPPPPPPLPRLPVLLAIVVSAALAAALYASHLEAPRTLWIDVNHDRNGHYAFAAGLALAIRDLDLARFAQDIAGARIWPPLHGLLLAPVLAAFGPDFRLAGAVSAAAWAATIAGAFALARRLLADATAGIAAGGAAALFVAASPAMRAFAVDAMLESLGAALTIAALLAYVRLRERPAEDARWAQLGLVLTLLFFEKGNYWGLAVAALLLAAATIDPRALRQRMRAGASAPAARMLARRALVHPLSGASALAFIVAAALYLRGPAAIVIGGSTVSLYPPENLLTAAYALAFARLALLWCGERAAIAAMLPAGARRLLAWHAVPVAASFLVPKRLAAFLGFVGPANLPQGADAGLAAGARLYASWLIDPYHVAPWAAALALALAATGFALRRRLAPGHEAVFALAIVAALLTVLHPHRQPRFVHSWVAAWWIAAGLGLGAVVAALPLAAARRAVAAAAVLALVLAHEGGLTRGAAEARAAAHPDRPSTLDITDAYLGAIGGYRQAAVLSTIGGGSLVQWTYFDRYRRRDGITGFQIGLVADADGLRAALAAWLAATPADAIVLIEGRPNGSAAALPRHTEADLAPVGEEMARQRRFRRIAGWQVAGAQPVAISLWEAAPR